jgi:hypothetical protein
MSMVCGSALAQTDARLADGNWIGTGSFQIGPDILACSEIKMKFVGTPALFGVRDGSMACGSLNQAFPMHNDFDVRPNDEIYYQDQRVGNIAGNTLVVLVPGKDGIGSEFVIRREGDFLYYTEISGKPGEPPVFGMVAILKKDPTDRR